VEEFRVVLLVEHLNLFYTIEDNDLFFNGYKTYAINESNHLNRLFCVDNAIEILKDWCTINGMTESGWLFSIINIHKGDLEAGYIYAPYIPLQITEPIQENDHQLRRGLLSRYTTRQIEER
jgi:hypothetical protein